MINVNEKDVIKYRNTKAYQVGFSAGYNFASRYAKKAAQWERYGTGYRCTRCGALITAKEYHQGNHHYCHVCGSQMALEV